MLSLNAHINQTENNDRQNKVIPPKQHRHLQTSETHMYNKFTMLTF